MNRELYHGIKHGPTVNENCIVYIYIFCNCTSYNIIYVLHSTVLSCLLVQDTGAINVEVLSDAYFLVRASIESEGDWAFITLLQLLRVDLC